MPRIPLDAWKAAVEAEEAPEDVLLHKGFVVDEIKVLEAERAIRFVISTADVDRDRDTIDVNGWELADYRRNPVVLFGHDYRQPPIARALEVSVEGGALKSLAQFADAAVYPFADTIYRMLKAGYLNATSVGFRPVEWVFNEERRGVDFKKQMLLEFSVVPVPSNAHCLIEARADGVLTDDDAKLYLGWAEQILDEWHGEKGLWLPKSKVEDAFTALSTKTTVDMGQQVEIVTDHVMQPAEGNPPLCEACAARAETEAPAKEIDAAAEVPPQEETAPVPASASAAAPDDACCQCACHQESESRADTALETITHHGEVVSDEELNDWLARELGPYHHDTEPDPLAAVTPEMLGQLMLDLIRGSVDDALKRQITAVTGRLID